MICVAKRNIGLRNSAKQPSKNNARKSALSQKIKSKSFKVIDSLSMDAIKTKEFTNVLNSLEVSSTKVTMIVGDNDKNLYLSCRNLNDIKLVSAKQVSTYDIVNSNMLLFDKSGIEFLNDNL